MTVRIIQGDCRDVLAGLPAESVHCVVTSPQINGRFVKGTHWRPRKAHWDKAWLEAEYVGKRRSAAEIAVDMGCTENNILFWLTKHGIPRRTVSQVRAVKHWGVSGSANPMFGRTGQLNPRYVDGSSPDRQRAYVRAQGRAFLLAVYARDEFQCVRCSAPKAGPKSLHAHHIKPWAGNPALRFDLANAVTLCRSCHNWVHSKRNTKGEFLA